MSRDYDGAEIVEKEQKYQQEFGTEGGVVYVINAQKGECSLTLPYPLKSLPAGVQQYLGVSPMCETTAPEIVEKARELVAGKDTVYRAAVALAEYVTGHVREEGPRPREAGARWTLANARGDCTEHADLLVALARAAGIPARVVSGCIYEYDEDLGPILAAHSWVELWIGTWFPMDTTTGQWPLPARYLFREYSLDSSGTSDMRVQNWIWSGVRATAFEHEYEGK